MVLRIIENDNSPQREDTDIYIVYDTYHNVFLIRGKRSDTPRVYAHPYSFESESRFAVFSLLSYLIPNTQQCTIELYNYTNLPSNKNDITFELLRESRSSSTEMVAYLGQRIRYKSVMNTLYFMQNVVNEYRP